MSKYSGFVLDCCVARALLGLYLYLCVILYIELVHSLSHSCCILLLLLLLLLLYDDINTSTITTPTATTTEVKQELYTHSIGAWTRYQHQLEPLASELRKYLPKLKQAGALPGFKEMNWELSADFDYESIKRKSVSN